MIKVYTWYIPGIYHEKHFKGFQMPGPEAGPSVEAMGPEAGPVTVIPVSQCCCPLVDAAGVVRAQVFGGFNGPGKRKARRTLETTQSRYSTVVAVILIIVGP